MDMKDIKIFRVLNSVIIVENGSKQIITDEYITRKTDNEILTIYNNRKCGGIN